MSAETETISAATSKQDDNFSRIYRLYDDFDRTLKTKTDQKRLSRAYHPVLERARILKEWQERGQNSPLLPGLAQELRANIETTLAEHFKVKGGTRYMNLDEDQLWSPFFPVEPFIEVVRRGAALRKALGSPDQDRETAEITGWKKITQKLLDGPIGTRVVSLSPPSQNGGPYTEQYVDEFISSGNGKETRVLTRRTAVNLTISDYEALALSVNPNYFDGYDPETPIDAWFLSHPFTSSVKIPVNRIIGYPPEKFEKILTAVDQLINRHQQSLLREVIDWNEVVSTLNTLFYFANKFRDQLETLEVIPIPQFDRLSLSTMTFIASQPIHLVTGGCGISGGFESARSLLLQNSVAQFGLGGRSSEYHHIGTCAKCHQGPKRVGDCSICEDCVITYFS